MRPRDKKKLRDSEWNKRVLNLPFEDQVEHGLTKDLHQTKAGEQE